MPQSPFFPRYDALPTTLPVFPLAGVMVMPGAELPLNIYERRYLNMVEDALKTHHMFGVLQPIADAGAGEPPLNDTGCAGRITSYSETADGRILLSLTGLVRFRVAKELQPVRGYRRVVPVWGDFAADLNVDDAGAVLRDRAQFIRVLRRFAEEKELEVDWELLEQMPDLSLVHSLVTLLPLKDVEKQALVETLDPHERAETLLAALELSTRSGSPARH